MDNSLEIAFNPQVAALGTPTAYGVWDAQKDGATFPSTNFELPPAPYDAVTYGADIESVTGGPGLLAAKNTQAGSSYWGIRSAITPPWARVRAALLYVHDVFAEIGDAGGEMNFGFSDDIKSGSNLNAGVHVFRGTSAGAIVYGTGGGNGTAITVSVSDVDYIDMVLANTPNRYQPKSFGVLLSPLGHDQAGLSLREICVLQGAGVRYRANAGSDLVLTGAKPIFIVNNSVAGSVYRVRKVEWAYWI